MTKFKATFTFFLVLLAVVAFPVAGETPQELLLRIDQARNVVDLRCDVTLTSYDGEKILEHEKLAIQVKTTSKENKTLVWFAAPASVKGRRLLMAGNTVYLLFPATSNPIRLSPLQVLVGQASNGDVARTGFAQEFLPQKLTRTSLDGQACWLFELTAQPDRQTGTYAKARLWVRSKDLRPLKAEFLTASDELLKIARYSDWRQIDGKQFPCKLVITEADNPKRYTVLTYSHIASHPVPSSLFERSALSFWVAGGSQ